jgi:hypothetical protein
MTCSCPPEARRPVTIVVVAYVDRGDRPFTNEVSLYDAGVALTQRPLREVPTFAGNLFVIPGWDDVTHTTPNQQYLSTLIDGQSLSFTKGLLSPTVHRGMNPSQNTENPEFFRISLFRMWLRLRRAVPVANMH